ncbi:acyl-CoA dehydrogenase family protein [Pseudacidovorax intermedius]|uniref:Acyl-CoA dehydrogenase n=1 Tax=Pseudacidovorax intermedius TaxID=433924 RepID=A0A370F3R1_9BURK|nr:acyl-CoA dehydrogenase family protein [Pseudacidovorax intermedius]RDI17713.1 acyl-CoA dehydrogenase [Pseudacidovorax intermedius]
MQALDIRPAELPPDCEQLRAEVRDFLAQTLGDLPPHERARNWSGYSPEFSRALGQRGWIGMTWPRRYGGGERSMLERYVVLEELLAAGAPVSAHWVADRQSGPLLMRYSPEVLAPELLPRIARGECHFCIGMSEPDSGSDLASIRTRAVRDGDGWRISGRKVWTSAAHKAHYMIALVRTAPPSADRHAGMSQFLVDMRSPGLTIRPIVNQLGEHEFNEVTFDDVPVPAHHLIGAEGEGWHQVTTELTFERSGPERYMSSTQLMLEMLDAADADNPHHQLVLGRLAAQYATLRQMSLGVAGMLAEGQNPGLAAAAVKDQGALLEQGLPDLAHELFGGRMPPESDLARVQRHLVLATPSFSLRGGTREILRGMLAKGMGLR